MGAVVTFVLWIWLGVSLAAVAIQSIRRFRYNRTRGPGAAQVAPVVGAPGSRLQTAPRNQLDQAGRNPAVADRPPVTPLESTQTAAPQTANIQAEPTQTATPPTTTIQTAAPSKDSLPQTPMTALLAGIELPCDLVPTPPDDKTLAKTANSFVAKGHEAAEVGGALADELERLDYVISSVSDSEARATRGAEQLTMAIRSQADSVTVDMWVGDGPNPLA